MPQHAAGILSGQEERESTSRPTDTHPAAIALESLSKWCPPGTLLQALRRLLKSVFIQGLEKEMATHPSILAWRIPWTEELGGLQSMGSQRVGTTE